MVSGVRELLAQALSNLVDNALKYGRAEGRAATVTLRVETAGDRAVLSVADNDPGVPEGDRARVLDRFTRLEASRSAPGSGLGLALVAAVARHHAGTIELADAAPGLKVILRLPAAG
jgi:signal transduction histidine kinase